MLGLGWLGTFLVAFNCVASAFTLVMNMPGMIRVVKTKDTKSLSKLMMLLSFIGGFLWGISGILQVVYIYGNNGDASGWMGLPTSLANFSLAFCSLYMFVWKVKNLKKGIDKK